MREGGEEGEEGEEGGDDVELEVERRGEGGGEEGEQEVVEGGEEGGDCEGVIEEGRGAVGVGQEVPWEVGSRGPYQFLPVLIIS